MGAIIFLIFIYFAFIRLPHVAANFETRDYFNPLNNLFLFFGGFCIGKLLNNIQLKLEIAIIIILLGVAILIFYPAFGKRIDLITGMNRLVFTCSSFLICAGFYKMSYTFPNIIHKPFIFLGEISYSMYLIHALVFKLMSFLVRHFIQSPICIMGSSVVGTLIFSYFIYHYFEKFFMPKGTKQAQVSIS